MKKLLLLLTMLLPLVANAYDVKIDGIYYNLSENEAEVTRQMGLNGGIVSYSGVVNIPETITSGGNTYTVTGIGSFAFNQCTGLTKVVIPNSVTIIKEYAFSGCTGLSTVVMGEGVTVIKEAVFFGCHSLTSITIPGSVVSIGVQAFSGCGLTKVIVPDIAAWCGIKFNVNDASSNPLSVSHRLYSDETTEIRKLIIPDGVTSIGGSAFIGCSNLNSVTIPESVTSIGDCAFIECTALRDIICLAKTPPTIQDYTFTEDHYNYAYLYVPSGCHETYKSASNWERFYNIFELETPKGDVNEDGDITIADGVAVLNAMAGQTVSGNPDVNEDGEVTIADFVAVLNIMAGQ